MDADEIAIEKVQCHRVGVVRNLFADTAERVRNLLGRGERNIGLNNPIPVHVTYQTAFDETGKLQIRPDFYGRDAQILKLLRNEHRPTDVPIARNDNANSRRAISKFQRQQESGLSGFFRQFGN